MTIEIPEIVALEREVARLKQQFSIFQTTIPFQKQKKTISIKEIANIEEVSISQLRPNGAERYLLPRFGQSGYPTGKTRWDIAEYQEWREIDPEERRQAYLEYLRNNKQYQERNER